MGRVFFIIGFALFVLGIVLVIVAPIGKRKNKRCSAQTQGVLRKISGQYGSNGARPTMKYYSYTVDGVEYQLKSTAINPHASNVGDQCPIWYDPKKPSVALEHRYGSNKLFHILLLVGILMLLSPILLAVLYAAFNR